MDNKKFADSLQDFYANIYGKLAKDLDATF